MRINNNVAAFNAYRNLAANGTALSKSLEKLSSGLRINRAGDDAAGLVISQNLRSQVSGLTQATRNAQDGISVVQTAEGALNEVHNMLGRMRDLAVQSANSGANDTDARQAADDEATALKSEIDRIANTTKFGSVDLLKGTYGKTAATTTGGSTVATFAAVAVAAGDKLDVTINGKAVTGITLAAATGGSNVANEIQAKVKAAFTGAGNYDEANNFSVTAKQDSSGKAVFTVTSSYDMVLANGTNNPLTTMAVTAGTYTAGGGAGGTFQVGASNGTNERIALSIGDMRVNAGAGALTTLSSGVNLTTEAGAQTAIDTIDTAIKNVSTQRGKLGAAQNRFESVIANLQVTTENLTASESRIRDTDYSSEMVKFTRGQILNQAATSMLGQANKLPQGVLSLLQG
jgi:flagellin